jgi:hypothetical protein
VLCTMLTLLLKARSALVRCRRYGLADAASALTWKLRPAPGQRARTAAQPFALFGGAQSALCGSVSWKEELALLQLM